MSCLKSLPQSETYIKMICQKKKKEFNTYIAIHGMHSFSPEFLHSLMRKYPIYPLSGINGDVRREWLSGGFVLTEVLILSAFVLHRKSLHDLMATQDLRIRCPCHKPEFLLEC